MYGDGANLGGGGRGEERGGRTVVVDALSSTKENVLGSTSVVRQHIVPSSS